jgi:hypothetical protein
VEGPSVQLDPDTPRTVRAAGVLVGLQGLGGIVAAVVLMVQPGVLRPADRFGEAAFFALMAAAVIAFGVALVLGKRGARSPVVVMQLLLLGIAGYATVPVAVVCLLVLYLLLNSAVREWAMDLQATDQDPD